MSGLGGKDPGICSPRWMKLVAGRHVGSGEGGIVSNLYFVQYIQMNIPLLCVPISSTDLRPRTPTVRSRKGRRLFKLSCDMPAGVTPHLLHLQCNPTPAATLRGTPRLEQAGA